MNRVIVFVLLSFFLLFFVGCSSSSEDAKGCEEQGQEEGIIQGIQSKEKDLYSDSVFWYFGKDLETIIQLHGEPSSRGVIVSEKKGDFISYQELGISFISTEGDVVNELQLYSGVEILGAEVGMTLNQIKEVWGTPGSQYCNFGSKSDDIVTCWMGEGDYAEFEFCFFSPTMSAPTRCLKICWREGS